MNNRPMRLDTWKALIVFWLFILTFVVIVASISFADRLTKVERPVESHVVSVVDADSDLLAQGWERECMSYGLDGSCVHYIYVRWS